MINTKLYGAAVLAIVLSACGGSGGSNGGASSQSTTSSTQSAGQSSVSSQQSLSSALASSSSSSEEGSSSEVSSSSEAVSSSSETSSSSEAVSSSSQGNTSSLPSHPTISQDCILLSTDRSVNWRDTSLQTDQEIVECLSTTLGRAVGYGENALGGYDPNGNSKLTIIKKSDSRSVEEQVRDAIAGDDHNWIVFDKIDFADEYEISLHRLWCSDANMLTAIGGTTQECLDYRTWCSNRSITNHNACMEEFFNKRLNSNSLNNVRNPIVGSNTTIDGRQNNAYFRFMGFRIGNDSSGVSTKMSNSVIITHVDFKGAGHNEDHKIDPDMIRSTGESHDIWIHKNRFDLTGDSAFDVKVGAYNITMSFNEVIDVKRAALHGSSDSRTINEQITTTMHHNAFFTRDEHYMAFGNTGRRVPLIRRGTSHMFNNVFTNYRKDVLSVRVGARVLFEDNAFLINQIHQEKDSLETSLTERQEQLLRDVDSSHLQVTDSYLWFSEGTCKLIAETQRDLSDVKGSGVADLSLDYTNESRTMMWANYLLAGQDLVDYVSATAGPDGELPFNSPLAKTINEVLGQDRCSGAPPASGGPGGGLPAPDAPSLEVDNLEVGQLTLTWADVNRATGYTLRYGTTDDIDGDLIEITNITSPYTLTGLEDGVTYYVFLRTDGAGGNSDWAEAQATTIDLSVPPSAPTALRLRVGNEQLTANWNPVPGATSYELIYNTVDSIDGAMAFAGNPLTETSATITSLINDTRYYVFVRAANPSGWGEYTASVNAEPREAEPAACYIDDFTGSYAALSTDGFDQVNSFEWSSRRGAQYAGGRLTSVNDSAALGFFKAPGESIALDQEGDKVRVSIDFTYTTSGNDNGSNRLRFALMQSVANPAAGARNYFTPEGSPNTNARPEAGLEWSEDGNTWTRDYRALMGTMGQLGSNPGRAVSADHLRLFERNQSDNVVLGGSTLGSGYTELAVGGAAFSIPNDGTGFVNEAMNITMEVELVSKNGNQGLVNITYTYSHNGNPLSSVSLNNHATETLSFDAVGLFFRFSPGYAYEKVVVEHIPVGNAASPCAL